MTDRTTAQIAAQHIDQGAFHAFIESVKASAPTINSVEDASNADHTAVRAATKFALEQIVAHVSAISFESNSPEFDRGARWAQAELRRMINDIARAPLPEIK